MQLTYRGTPYTQTSVTVATTRKTIGQYRGATCAMTTTTLNSVSRTVQIPVQMIYRGVPYLGTTTPEALPPATGLELAMSTYCAIA